MSVFFSLLPTGSSASKVRTLFPADSSMRYCLAQMLCMPIGACDPSYHECSVGYESLLFDFSCRNTVFETGVKQGSRYQFGDLRAIGGKWRYGALCHEHTERLWMKFCYSHVRKAWISLLLHAYAWLGASCVRLVSWSHARPTFETRFLLSISRNKILVLCVRARKPLHSCVFMSQCVCVFVCVRVCAHFCAWLRESPVRALKY